MTAKRRYLPSDAAKAAGDYFNSLPIEQRRELAPLLEHYRQMGIAEAGEAVDHLRDQIDRRVRAIRGPA